MSAADQKIVRSVHKLWAKSLKGRSLSDVQEVLKHSNDEAFLLLGGGLASIAKGLSLKPDRDPSGSPSSPGGGGGGVDTSLVHASNGSTRLKALLLKELRSALSPAFHVEANEGTQFRPSIKRVRSALEFVTASVSCGVPRGAAGILTSVAEQNWISDPGCAELALSCYRAVTASILSLPAPSLSSEASNGGSKIRAAYVEAHGEPTDTSSSIALSPVAILSRYIAHAALMFDTEHDGGDAFKSELLVSVSQLQVTDGKKKSGKADPLKEASEAAVITTPVTVVGTLEALRTLHLLACEAYDVASHSANADPTFEDTKNSVKPPLATSVASPGGRAEMFKAGKAIPSSFAAEKYHAAPKAASGAAASPSFVTVTHAQAISANHALRRTVDFAVPKLLAPLIHLSKVKPVELEGEPNANSGTASIRDAAALVLADFTWLCCHRAPAGATSVHETAARASVEKLHKTIFGTLALSLRSAADGAHAAVLRATHDAEEASLKSAPGAAVPAAATTTNVTANSNEIIQTGEDGGLSRHAYDEACKAMLDAHQPGDEQHCFDSLYSFHEPASSSIGKANLRVMFSAASRIQAAILRTSAIAPFEPSAEDESSNISLAAVSSVESPAAAPATARKGERPPSPSLPKEKIVHKAPAWQSIFSSIRDLISIPLAPSENKGSLVQMSGLILSFASIQSEALRVLACSMTGLLPNLVALLRDRSIDGKSRAFIEGTLHVLLTTTSEQAVPKKLFDNEESKEESKLDSENHSPHGGLLHSDPSHPLCKPLFASSDLSFSTEFLDAVAGVDSPQLFFSRVIDPRVFFVSDGEGSTKGAPPVVHSSKAISEPVLPAGLTRSSGSSGPWLGTIDLSLLLSAGYRAPVPSSSSSPVASSSRPVSRAGGSTSESSSGASDSTLPPSPTAPSSVFDHACHTMPISSTPGASAWPVWNITLDGLSPTDLWAPVMVGSGSLGHDEEQVVEPVAPPVAASTAPSKAAGGSTAKGGPASVAPSKAAPHASSAAPAASVAGTKAAGGKAATVAPTVISNTPSGPPPVNISMATITRTFPSHMVDGADKNTLPDLITWESRLAGLRLTAGLIETANQSQTASEILLASKIPAMVARLAVDSASLVFKLPAVVSESTGGDKSGSTFSGELTSALLQSLLLSIQILDALLHLSSKSDRASVCTSLSELGPLCIDSMLAVALHSDVLGALLPAMRDVLKSGVSGGIDRTESFVIPVRLFDPRDSLDFAASGMLPQPVQECAELRSWAMTFLRSCAGADKDLRTFDRKSPAHPLPVRAVQNSSSSPTHEAAATPVDPKKGAAPAPAPAKDTKGKPTPAAAAAAVVTSPVVSASAVIGLSDVTNPATSSPTIGVDWDCATESSGERLSLLVLRHVPLLIQAYSHPATCSGTLDLLTMRLNGMSSLYTPQSTDPKTITVSPERKIISGSVIRIGILRLLDEIAFIYRGRDRLVSEILALIRDFSAVLDIGNQADLSPALSSAKRILNCQRAENNVPFIYGRLGCLVLGSSSSFNAQLHATPLSLAAQAKQAADEAKASEAASSAAPAASAAAGGKGGKDAKKAEAPKKTVAMAVETPAASDPSALIASILAARRAWVHPVELSGPLPPPLLTQAEDLVVNGSIVSRSPFLPPVLHGIDLFCTSGSPFFLGGRGLEFENKTAPFFTPSSYLWALAPGSTSHISEALTGSAGALLEEAKKVAIETAAHIEHGLVVDDLSFSTTHAETESLSAHIAQDIVKFALSAVAVSSILSPIASILRHMEPLPSELELVLALRVIQTFSSDMHRGISTQSAAAEAAVAESISAGCVVHALALSELPPLPSDAIVFSKNPTLACMIQGVNTSLKYPMHQWKGMLMLGPQGRGVLSKQAGLLFKWLHSRPTARSSFWGRVKQSITRPLSAAEAEYIANAGDHIPYPKGVIRVDKEASTITEEMFIGRDDPLYPSVLDSLSASSKHHHSIEKGHDESSEAGAIVIAPLSDSIIGRRKGHAFEVFGARLDESALNGRLCRITNIDPMLASLPYGISAIIAAIALDSSVGDEAVASLLANGVSPDNGREDDGVTPLMLSLLFGKVSLAKTILDFGANIHAKDYTGNNALKYSFLSTSKASRTQLCELESNREARAVDLPRLTRYQDHPLDAVLESLMTASSTVSITDSSAHGTPGRASQSKNHLQPRVQPRVAPIASKPRKKAQAVRNEIRKGEDSEKQAERDAASFNGLVSRSEEAAVRMLQRLVRRGMFRRRIAEARVFLSAEASDINTTSVPVFYTDWTIAFDAISLLISRGADATIGDAAGNTAVHWLTVGTTLFEVVSRVRACRFSPVCSVSNVPKIHTSEILSMLIASDANLDHQNLAGATPLHCACEIGHLWTASKLLSLGANAFYLDRLNCLPLHYAALGRGLPSAREARLEGYSGTPFPYDDSVTSAIAAVRSSEEARAARGAAARAASTAMGVRASSVVASAGPSATTLDSATTIPPRTVFFLNLLEKTCGDKRSREESQSQVQSDVLHPTRPLDLLMCGNRFGITPFMVASGANLDGSMGLRSKSDDFTLAPTYSGFHPLLLAESRFGKALRLGVVYVQGMSASDCSKEDAATALKFSIKIEQKSNKLADLLSDVHNLMPVTRFVYLPVAIISNHALSIPSFMFSIVDEVSVRADLCYAVVGLSEMIALKSDAMMVMKKPAVMSSEAIISLLTESTDLFSAVKLKVGEVTRPTRSEAAGLTHSALLDVHNHARTLVSARSLAGRNCFHFSTASWHMPLRELYAIAIRPTKATKLQLQQRQLMQPPQIKLQTKDVESGRHGEQKKIALNHHIKTALREYYASALRILKTLSASAEGTLATPLLEQPSTLEMWNLLNVRNVKTLAFLPPDGSAVDGKEGVSDDRFVVFTAASRSLPPPGVVLVKRDLPTQTLNDVTVPDQAGLTPLGFGMLHLRHKDAYNSLISGISAADVGLESWVPLQGEQGVLESAAWSLLPLGLATRNMKSDSVAETVGVSDSLKSTLAGLTNA